MRTLVNHVDGCGIRKESTSHVEVICNGTNWFTRNVVRQLCHVCHFPNFAKKYCAGEDTSQFVTKFIFADNNAPEYDENSLYWKTFWSSFEKLNTICRLSIIDPKSETPIVIDPLSGQEDNSWFDIEFIVVKCDFNSDFLRKYIHERERKNAIITLIDLSDEKKENHALSEVRQSTVDLAEKIFEEKIGERKCNWEQLNPHEFESYLLTALVWEYRFRSMGTSSRKPDIRKVKSILGSEKEIYGIMEHNRWVTETVLSGLSPLTEEDLLSYQTSTENLSSLKNEFKKTGKHLDICSFKKLNEIDPDSIPEDYQHNDIILSALSGYRHKRITVLTDKLKIIRFHKNIGQKICLAALLTILTFSVLFALNTFCEGFSLPFSSISTILDAAVYLVCTFAGWFGIISIVSLIHFWYYDRVLFDKMIAEAGGKSIAYLMSFIICFPCSLAMIAQIWVKPYDMIYDRQLYHHNTEEGITQIEQEIAEKSEDPNIYWTFFYHFTDPGNQHMTGTPKGRMIALFVGFLGSVFLTGLLISSLLSYWEKRKEKWNNGEIFYRFHEPYIVLLGDSDLLPIIIKQNKNRYPDLRYFVILTSHSIPEIRQHYLSSLDSEIMDQVVFYHGDYSSSLDVSKLNIWNPQLRAVYIIGEEENLEFHVDNDTKNIKSVQCVLSERQLKKGKFFPSLLPCYAMFEEQTSYISFIRSEISNEMKRYLLLTPFNRYELWAQKVLISGRALNHGREIIYKPLDVKDGKGIITNSCNHIHLVIEGMNHMGLSLAREAALNCHYSNFAEQEWKEEEELIKGKTGISSSKGKMRTRITFIDDGIQCKMSRLMNRHKSLFEISKWRFSSSDSNIASVPWNDNMNKVKESCISGYNYKHLTEARLEDSNFMDVEWEFVEGSLHNQNVESYLKETSADETEFLTVAVCHDDGRMNIELATNLSSEIIDHSIQVLVYQQNDCNIVEQYRGVYSTATPKNKYTKLVPFGMLSDSFDQDSIDGPIAKVLHHCKKPEDRDIPYEEMNWSGKTILQRWSSVYSGHGWYSKFRSINFDLKNGDISSLKEVLNNSHTKELLGRVEHNRWCMERLLILDERPLLDSEYNEFSSIIGENYWQPDAPENSPIESGHCRKAPTEYNRLKDFYKGKAVHLDLCSFWMLRKRDFPAIDFDIERFERFINLYGRIKELL